MPLQIIGKSLGHRSLRSAERYARTSEAALRAIVEASVRLNQSSAANSLRELRAASGVPSTASAASNLLISEGFKLERATRVELATSSLGSWRSTN